MAKRRQPPVRRQQHQHLPCELTNELLAFVPKHHCHCAAFLSASSVVHSLLARNKTFRRWQCNKVDAEDKNRWIGGIDKLAFIPRLHKDSFPFKIPQTSKLGDCVNAAVNFNKYFQSTVDTTGRVIFNVYIAMRISRFGFYKNRPDAELEEQREKLRTHLKQIEQSILNGFFITNLDVLQLKDIDLIVLTFDEDDDQNEVLRALKDFVRKTSVLLEQADGGGELTEKFESDPVNDPESE